MPSLEQNLDEWDAQYPWQTEGDEWSEPWGGADAQWHACVLPRLRHLLPAARIVEIAPGHGRWTQFLAGLADHLQVVDLSPACIEVCRQRFAGYGHIDYVINDGRSLPTTPDGTVDLVFSFDSLVHIEADVMADYLREIRRALAPDGAAFIHHSNIGPHRELFERLDLLSDTERSSLAAQGRLPLTHWRAFSMSADRVDELAQSVDLHCVGQELIDWGDGPLIDAISVLTRPGSHIDGPRRVVENPFFMAEARSARRAQQAFGRLPRPVAPAGRDVALGDRSG